MAAAELRINPATLASASSMASTLGTEVASLQVGGALAGGGSAATGLASGAACSNLGSTVGETSRSLGRRWADFSDNLVKAAQRYAQADEALADKIGRTGDHIEPDGRPCGPPSSQWNDPNPTRMSPTVRRTT